MPNWCCGFVQVKGKPKDVENFCKLFIFEDEVDKKDSKKGQKFFARSFIHEDWKDFKEEHLGNCDLGEGIIEVEFGVDFAWSCWSCMFDGYPTKNKKENPEGFGNCVTLEWAIKKYNVDVSIETEEGGEGFEEEITTKNKKPIHISKDMPEHKCYKCGNKQLIPTNEDLSDVECWECGKYGFVDELTEIIKEKIKQINDRDKNET